MEISEATEAVSATMAEDRSRSATPSAARSVRLSTKSKVTLVATALFLLCLLLVSSIQLYFVKTQMQRVLADQQYAFISRVADEIDQKLTLNRDAIAAAAAAMPPQRVNDVERLERMLAESITLRSLFTDLFIHSSKGFVLVDMPPQRRRDIAVSDQEYFQMTLATGKPYISKPFLGKVSKEPVITISAPIFDRQGDVVAVLSGSLNLLKANFLGNLGDAKVGKSGSFALFTRDRMIVMSRDKERIMTQGPPPGVSPYFDHATSGLEGAEEALNSRGLRAIFAYSQLRVVPWVLVAALPVDEAYAPIQVAQRKILTVTLLLALLVAALIWLAVRRWFDPLQTALRERESGLQRAQSMAKLAHVITGPGGRFESWSDSLPKLTGIGPARMPVNTREWLEKIHPDDRARFRQTSIDAAAKRIRSDIEYRLIRADDDVIHVRQAIEPIDENDDDSGLRWFNTLQDVTIYKQAEEKIRRLNRLYALLSGINGLIVRSRSRDQLFKEACGIAVREGKFALAWIGVVDQSEMRLAIVAWEGDGGAYAQQLAAALNENFPQGLGLCAQAIREGKAVVANDIANDPGILIRDEVLARGFRSLAVVPLRVAGRPYGVLTLCAEQSGFFDDAEMKLLHELAGDISFALDRVEKEDQA